MDKNQAPTPTTALEEYSTPGVRFDMSNVAPHSCMVDIVQTGNYIHCNIGNHGMRIPAGKILTRTSSGWQLIDMVVVDSTKPSTVDKAQE